MHSGGSCFLCKLWGSHKGAKFKAHSWQYLNPRLTRARSKKRRRKKESSWELPLRNCLRQSLLHPHTLNQKREKRAREHVWVCVCVCWLHFLLNINYLHGQNTALLSLRIPVSSMCSPPANHKRTLSRSLSSTSLAKIKKYLKSKFFKSRWLKQASQGLKMKKLTSKGPPHTQTHTLEDLTSLFRVLLLPLRLKLPSWKRSRRGGRRGCGRAFLFLTPPPFSLFLSFSKHNLCSGVRWGGGGGDPAYLTPGLSLDTHLPSSILWWSPH